MRGCYAYQNGSAVPLQLLDSPNTMFAFLSSQLLDVTGTFGNDVLDGHVMRGLFDDDTYFITSPGGRGH
jgi:hypothetical protein